jgi:ADP-ribose pyrophosphatase YjhB (NUDIX family)
VVYVDSIRRIPAAGAIVFDDLHRILLIRRGREPGRGLWSIPGGKCLPDEPSEACCVRETLEECGLPVRPVRFAGRVQRTAPDGGLFVIDDYLCELVSPSTWSSVRAGDDADEAGWFGLASLSDLPLVEGLVEALTDWDLLPE